MACLIYQPHRANGAMKTTTELLSDRIVPRALFVATVDSHIWYFHMPYLRMLRDMGFQVEVAAAPVGFAERIRAEGYEVHTIPFSRNPLNLRNIAAYRALRRLMQSRHYVMVHVHTPVAGFLGRLAARRQGVPHIVYTAHGLSLIHISEPTRLGMISYAVFCLK